MNNFKLEIEKILIDLKNLETCKEDEESYQEQKQYLYQSLLGDSDPADISTLKQIMDIMSHFNSGLAHAVTEYSKDVESEKHINDLIAFMKTMEKFPRFLQKVCTRLVIASIALSVIKKLKITAINSTTVKQIIDAIKDVPKPLNIHVPIDKKLLNAVASLRVFIDNIIKMFTSIVGHIPASDHKRTALKHAIEVLNKDFISRKSNIKLLEAELYDLPTHFIAFMHGDGSRKPIAYFVHF